jgi:16S rRNA (adenine1518-N6/adenine1519-N6)-dimethyltransferase
VAVELDTQLAASLRGQLPANVELHKADAREVAVEELLGGCVDYKLVGNLPYYAATPILRHFLEGACKPSVAVVMVQLEVAREICAEPGKMSLLSVGVQLYGRPRIVRLVRPGSFIPPPKVTSAIVAIDVYKQPAEAVEDSTGFFQVVRAGFSAPRKQLHNSLAQGLAIPQAQAEQLLNQSGVEPSRRAEALSLDEWTRLYRSWTSQR